MRRDLPLSRDDSLTKSSPPQRAHWQDSTHALPSFRCRTCHATTQGLQQHSEPDSQFAVPRQEEALGLRLARVVGQASQCVSPLPFLRFPAHLSHSTVEPGKGRKCVILVGRPREVLKMSWTDLRQAGGLGETEFWMNLSPKGTILATTAASQTVLGYSSQDLSELGFPRIAERLADLSP